MGQLLGCIKVKHSKVSIKERFGRFDSVLQPGCHCLPWCLGYQVAGSLSLRVQQFDVQCKSKTKDNVFVNVVAFVQYRVIAENASDAFYRFTNSREQIKSYVFDVIGASVSKFNLDDVFERKNDIAKAVKEEWEKWEKEIRSSTLGKEGSTNAFEILQTFIVEIEPDFQVKRAMNEINAAARKKLQIKNPEGESESKHLSGLGIARQHQAIVEGLRDGVLAISKNLTQYLDAMKESEASSGSSPALILRKG